MRKCVITHIFDVTVKVKDKVLFQKKHKLKNHLSFYSNKCMENNFRVSNLKKLMNIFYPINNLEKKGWKLVTRKKLQEKINVIVQTWKNKQLNYF